MSGSYSVIDKNGNILRSGFCSKKDFSKQTNSSSEIAVDIASNDVEDKFVKDHNGNWKKQKRTPADIKARRDKLKPKEIPHGEQQANITNDQLDALILRLETLEGIVNP